MIDFQDEDEDSGIRQAYCAACRDVVTVDDEGCTECRDGDEVGESNRLEPVIAEGLAPSSPRVNECPTCGEDPGQFCYPGHDAGAGWNHEARVELVADAAELERVAFDLDRTVHARPRGRR